MTAATMPTGLTCEIEDGALVTAPIYENHKRGKNWLAVIAADPTAPGGLARTFAKSGRGRYLYLLTGLAEGQPVEFGADYYSGSGTKRPQRWYGVIDLITDTRLLLLAYPTAKQAIAAAKLRAEVGR